MHMLSNLKDAIQSNPQGTKFQAGVDVVVVQTHAQLEVGLEALKASASDNIFSVDLEWIPHSKEGLSMMQLASIDFCLIIRLCYFQHFPRRVKDFLRNPNNVFIGRSGSLSLPMLSPMSSTVLLYSKPMKP
jgi:hypothetical protein